MKRHRNRGASRAGLGGYTQPPHPRLYHALGAISLVPRRLATPLQIMLEGPAGSALSVTIYRPQLCGHL